MLGIGVENFQVEYLKRGTSSELPRFPHSLELGVLSQTGLLGRSALRRPRLRRGRGDLAPARAAAGAGRRGRGRRRCSPTGSYHASVDWFWEFAPHGARARRAGLAGALAPRAATGRARPRPALLLARGLVTLAVCLSLALPWLAELEVDRAASSWAANPDAALRRLDRAESLNPLSARAPLTAATIALRLDRRDEAEREFGWLSSVSHATSIRCCTSA